MSRRAAVCAIASLTLGSALNLGGCALSHERPFFVDAAAAAPDAPLGRDAGTPTSCTERWTSLPACPADPLSALGQSCIDEGLDCGTICCQPTPSVGCRGGVWVELPTPDCSAVDCIGPIPCGTGACGVGQVCLRNTGESIGPDRCVTPPFELNACGDLPEAWRTTPSSCDACLCGGVDRVEIHLECACCDA